MCDASFSYGWMQYFHTYTLEMKRRGWSICAVLSPLDFPSSISRSSILSFYPFVFLSFCHSVFLSFCHTVTTRLSFINIPLLERGEKTPPKGAAGKNNSIRKHDLSTRLPRQCCRYKMPEIPNARNTKCQKYQMLEIPNARNTKCWKYQMPEIPNAT